MRAEAWTAPELSPLHTAIEGILWPEFAEEPRSPFRGIARGQGCMQGCMRCNNVMREAFPNVDLDPGRGYPQGVLRGWEIVDAVHRVSERGGLLLYDDFEMNLGPHAIGVLMRYIREAIEIAEETTTRGLAVVITTHSPIVMDEFEIDRDGIYVCGTFGLKRATALFDPAWLCHFDMSEALIRNDFEPAPWWGGDSRAG